MTGTTRQNIFTLRRSNVSGKIPTTSQLLVGEMAVNTQDGFLYTSIADIGGTTTTEVRQIGWDRLSTISGGTVNGNVIFNTGITVNTNFQYVDGNQTNGYVLTSDASGNATWQLPSMGLKTKVGFISGGTFVGNPKTAAVTFTSNFSNTNYAIILTGGANRVYTYSNQTISGFTINANANPAFTENVYWQAVGFGETT
jgi:hypothetical protein